MSKSKWKSGDTAEISRGRDFVDAHENENQQKTTSAKTATSDAELVGYAGDLSGLFKPH